MNTIVGSKTLGTELNGVQISSLNKCTLATRQEKITYIAKCMFQGIPSEKRSECMDVTIIIFAFMDVCAIGPGVGAAYVVGGAALMGPVGWGMGAGLVFLASIEAGRRAHHNIPLILASPEYEAYKQQRQLIRRNAMVKQLIDEDEILKHFKCPITNDLPIIPVNDTPPSNVAEYEHRMTYEYSAVIERIEKRNGAPFYRGELPFTKSRLYFDYFHAMTIVMRLSKILASINLKGPMDEEYGQDGRDHRIIFPEVVSLKPEDLSKRKDLQYARKKCIERRERSRIALDRHVENPAYQPPTLDIYREFRIQRPSEQELKRRVDELHAEIPQISEIEVKERSERVAEVYKAKNEFISHGRFAKKITPIRLGPIDWWKVNCRNHKPLIECSADVVSAQQIEDVFPD